MSNKPKWLLDAEQRAKENERLAQQDPGIRAHLRAVEKRTERLRQMQAELNGLRVRRIAHDQDEAPAPKMAPRTGANVVPLRSRHAGRRARQATYRPHTLEERRDEAQTHEYQWRGIERTAPARIARQYAL